MSTQKIEIKKQRKILRKEKSEQIDDKICLSTELYQQMNKEIVSQQMHSSTSSDLSFLVTFEHFMKYEYDDYQLK